MFVEPGDFATLAELALAISGCAHVCIRLANPESGEAQVAFFPDVSGVVDLPAALLPDGPGTMDRAALEREMAAVGMPSIAFWIGFPLRSMEGRVLGVLGVMDVQERSLPEPVLAQLAHLAEVLSRGIGMAASTIRTMARQSLGLIEDLTELQGKDAASPAVTGLLRFAAGREPLPGEFVAMQQGGAGRDGGRGAAVDTDGAGHAVYPRVPAATAGALGGDRAGVMRPARQDQSASIATMLSRRRPTAAFLIWLTRPVVTPRISAIS